MTRSLKSSSYVSGARGTFFSRKPNFDTAS